MISRSFPSILLTKSLSGKYFETRFQELSSIFRIGVMVKTYWMHDNDNYSMSTHGTNSLDQLPQELNARSHNDEMQISGLLIHNITRTLIIIGDRSSRTRWTSILEVSSMLDWNSDASLSTCSQKDTSFPSAIPSISSLIDSSFCISTVDVVFCRISK